MKREAGKLFSGVVLKPVAQPAKWEVLRRQAATLRDLAARGMRPRAYPKAAAELEALADRLEAEDRVTTG
jgi:hypothetical protein